MANERYIEAMKLVLQLEPLDQLRLVAEVASLVQSRLMPKPPRSIMELEGLGKEIWQDVDVDEYIKEERASWDR
jgi:hypothetical protein